MKGRFTSAVGQRPPNYTSMSPKTLVVLCKDIIGVVAKRREEGQSQIHLP